MAEQGKGFAGLLGNVFGTAPPAYMEGLLGQQATEDLRKRSIGTGIANALLGYAAMPKNQNLGLGRILAGAAQAGIGGARGVYDNAKTDYLQGQAIEQAKRKQEQDAAQRAAMEKAIAQYPEYADAIRANPALLSEIVKQQIAPRERKTATIGNQLIDVDTGKPIFTGKADIKPLPTYDVQQGRTKVTYQVQPDGTVKEIGRGSMDAPKAAPQISYKTETDANGNLIYIPNVPNAPVLNSKGNPVDYKPKESGSKPTEDALKAAGWLSQATNAYKNMQQAMGSPTMLSGAETPQWDEALAMTLGAEGLANLRRSPARQQFVQATDSLSEALLRAATGAGVNEAEAKQKVKELTPVWSDKPATKKQKLDAIPQYIESLRVRAGKAGEAVPKINYNQIIPAEGTATTIDFSSLPN